MAKLYALCLLQGQRCQFQRFKTQKYDNAEISLKLCASEAPCNQKLLITAQELLARGKCQKEVRCPYASKQCKLDYNKGAELLKNRWLFCLYGKEETENVPGLGRY
jgi:hypothetical protein